MNRFHHAVEASSDFIEVRRCGRWKIDLLRKSITEKGIDVSFAVDTVIMEQTYDVAVLVAAETEGFPGLDYVKSRGKQIASVELLKGNSSADGRSKSFASPLKLSADFIVPVYEMELVKLGIAFKGNGEEDRLVLRGA
ncbi:MAG: PIN domain-containing protein [Armatimonadota bacterium]